MTRSIQAIVVFVVAFLLIAACGVSFADATDTPDPCGPGKGWGLAKIEPSASAKPLTEAPIISGAVVDVSESAPRWTGVDDAAPAPSGVVLVQPRAPRAPPFA